MKKVAALFFGLFFCSSAFAVKDIQLDIPTGYRFLNPFVLFSAQNWIKNEVEGRNVICEIYGANSVNRGPVDFVIQASNYIYQPGDTPDATYQVAFGASFYYKKFNIKAINRNVNSYIRILNPNSEDADILKVQCYYAS